MGKGKLGVVACVLLIAVLLVAGCGGNGTEEKKDSITIGVSYLATSMDPQGYDTQITESILSNVYEPLVRVDADGNIIPGAAETWEISDDGLVYTFHLYEDMYFHDGTPVTAEDAAFSLQRCIDSSYVGTYFAYIDKIEAKDDLTLVVTLKYPYSPFLALAGAYSGITSKAYVEENEDPFLRQTMGSGPYKFVSYTQGDSMVFEAFDKYHLGKAPINKLIYKMTPNSSSAALALKNGELDVLVGVDSTNRAQIESDENLVLSSTQSLMSSLVAFNCDKEPFNDPKVRMAMVLAIDKEEVNIAATDGYATIADSHIPEGVIGYSPEDKTPAKDVEKAKSLLEEAGYKDGFEFQLLTTLARSAHAEVLQANLYEIGVEAKVEVVETAAFYDLLGKGSFDAYVGGWGYICPDPDVYVFDMFHSEKTSTGNYVRYSNPKVDEYLETARYSTSEEVRQEAYENAMAIIREEVPNIPIIWNDANIAFNKNLKGAKAINTEQYFIYNYSW
jgi:peptide/nickel transport system substrate-binding protein